LGRADEVLLALVLESSGVRRGGNEGKGGLALEALKPPAEASGAEDEEELLFVFDCPDIFAVDGGSVLFVGERGQEVECDRIYTCRRENRQREAMVTSSPGTIRQPREPGLSATSTRLLTEGQTEA